jgi:hypothetical protein
MEKFNFESMFEKKVVEDKEVVRRVRLEDEPISIHNYSDKDSFCALLAKHTDSREAFVDMIYLLSMVQENALGAQVNKALKDIDGYYDVAVQFKKMATEERDSIIKHARDRRDSNYYAAVQKSLWDSGENSLNIGCDPIGSPVVETENEVVLSALQDVSNIVENSFYDKQLNLDNTVNAVVHCMPSRVKIDYKTQLQKRNAVDKLISQFDKGELDMELDASKFSPAKEAGATLPHTMSPKEWLGTIGSAFVRYQYGPEFMVAFRDTNTLDVRKYSGSVGDFIIYSDESNSAFDLNVHPAFYCNNFNENRIWEWREKQAILYAKVNYEIQNSSSTGNDQLRRIELYKLFQRELAESYKSSNDDVVMFSDTMPYFGRLPNDCQDAVGGAKYLLRFFKRGYSTANQVVDNPQAIHFVSNSVADSFSENEYYPITLADINSVLLVPMDLWALSKWNRHPETSSKLFSTTFGISRLRVDLSDVMLYLKLFQLSHVYEMYRAWAKGDGYDFKSHSQKLIDNLDSKNPGFKSIFGASVRNFRRKLDVLRPYLWLLPGPIVGLWIAPNVSRQGKQSAKTMQKNSGFVSQMQLYGSFDDYQDQMNEVGLAPVPRDWVFDELFDSDSSTEEENGLDSVDSIDQSFVEDLLDDDPVSPDDFY